MRRFSQPEDRGLGAMRWLETFCEQASGSVAEPGEDDAPESDANAERSLGLPLCAFVRTAGKGKLQDYRWVDAASAPGTVVALSEFAEDDAAALLAPVGLSLVLGRYAGKLFLEVNGIHFDPPRTDGEGRIVHVDLMVAGSPECEDSLRSLAAACLDDMGRVSKTMASLIPWLPDTPLGYELHPTFLADLVATLEPVESAEPEAQIQYRLNSEDARQELADLLRRCALPPGDGALVVMTSHIDLERVLRRDAWRVLTTHPQRDPRAQVDDEAAALPLDDAWRTPPPPPLPGAFDRYIQQMRVLLERFRRPPEP